MTDRESSASKLYVETLGHFAVWRAKERLPDGVWSREKAVELFQYYLTHHTRMTSKEQIADDLWPGLDADQADRDFKVAMNALNDALEPERPSRTNAVYLTRQGSSYGLNQEAPIELDFVTFEEGVVTASHTDDPEHAAEFYRGALELYKGDYLPDQTVHDWTATIRERLLSLYLTGATQLATLCSEAGNSVEAVLWCQRVIELDPLWEGAYRLLMRSYLSQGNRPLAVKMYKQLEQKLAQELGLEPMNETKKVLQEALEGG